MDIVNIAIPVENAAAVRNMLASIIQAIDANARKTDRSPAPTLQEVREYAAAHRIAVNPDRFHSYYTRKQWLDAAGLPFRWQDKLQEWQSNGIVDRVRQQPRPAPARAEPCSAADVAALTEKITGGRKK